MILLLACNAATVPPEVASIRVDPVTEVTSFGAVFLDAQALGEGGQRLPVEVLVMSSSDPTVLRPGTSGSFECLDSGVAELALRAGVVDSSMVVNCSPVGSVEVSPEAVAVTLAADESQRVLEPVSVSLRGREGVLVESVQRHWTSSDEEVVQLDESNRLVVRGEGAAELTLQAGHVVKSVPVEVSRLLVARALQIAEGDVAEVPLEPARYRAVVHSDRPVVLRFEGADCTSGLAGTDLTVDCLLTRRGQVEVENPAPNGVGDGDAVAELELVRLPG